MKPPHLAQHQLAGSWLYTSGQLGFDAAGDINGDVAQQTRQVMANLATELAGQGMDLSCIVKTTVWLRHAEDFSAFNDAYAAAPGAHKPA